MEPEEIRQLRKRLGWSLADFGSYFSVTPQAVLKLEKGTAQPNDFALATMFQLRTRLDTAAGKQPRGFLPN